MTTAHEWCTAYALTDAERAEVVEARSHDLLNHRHATGCTEAVFLQIMHRRLINPPTGDAVTTRIPMSDPHAGWPMPSTVDRRRTSLRCLICWRPLRRRWWQRGIFRPLPLCHRRDALACQAAANARR